MFRNRVLAVPVLAFAISTFAYARDGAQYDSPNSWEEATGHSLYPSRSVSASTNYTIQALVGSDGSTVNVPPAGNVLFKARTNTSGQGLPLCVTVPAGGAQQTLFNETFTTAAATSYIEVNFSAQAAISAGSTADGVFLVCTVSQNGNSVPCSGTSEGPSLVNRIRSGDTRLGALLMTAYNGFVRADPSTSTTVDVGVRTTGGTAQVCYANLALHY